MTFSQEAARIPALEDVAMDLKSHAEEEWPRVSFQKANTSGRWVADPNFVAFKIQHARARSIVVTVFGLPDEHPDFDSIELKKDRARYSRFTVSEPQQAEEAKDSISRAASLKRQ